jgi:hypothetical protein
VLFLGAKTITQPGCKRKQEGCKPEKLSRKPRKDMHKIMQILQTPLACSVNVKYTFAKHGPGRKARIAGAK